jgi:hypothetical protein
MRPIENFLGPRNPDRLAFSIPIQYFTQFSCCDKDTSNQILTMILFGRPKTGVGFREGLEKLLNSTALIAVSYGVEYNLDCDMDTY